MTETLTGDPTWISPSEGRILDAVHSPSDVAALETDDRLRLCAELRQELISSISQTGGHLAASLGTVELIVALLSVWNPPKDKVVFDVGHQAYVWKILTGRRDRMGSIRQFGGLSGFLKREESPYDCYGAGHASTALSAAFGLAKSRDLQGEDYRVAAMVGDGGLTGGTCYEAMNNAGTDRESQFMMILNDNEMSISPNVGAVSQYLSRFASTPLFQRFKKESKVFLQKMPLGGTMAEAVHRLEESFKGFLTPGAVFEALGFEYFGPMDGHDVNGLATLFSRLANHKGPVVMHVVTQKGKGYEPAENDPVVYHGVKPNFDKPPQRPTEAGLTEKEVRPTPAFQDSFGQIMMELGESHPKVVGITAAMATGTGLTKFAQAFPDRFFDVGIAEEHATLFACGLAVGGMRPICAIYSTFLQRAFDMVIHDAALQKLPVIFCLDRAGLAGADGPTHHGAFDLSYLRLIPNLVLAAPRNGNELRDLIHAALQWDEGPFVIRYPKANSSPFEQNIPPRPIEIGRWERLTKGSKGAVLAVGPLVHTAMEAAKRLKDERGLKIEVVNARFIKPLDEKWLENAASKFSWIVTLEEGSLIGGFGEGVLAHLASLNPQSHPPVYSLGLDDEFVTHGPRDLLLKTQKLDVEGIYQTLARLENTHTQTP